jgi:predicted nucleic acid-binding protein
MTEFVLVDTNVILDVTDSDAVWKEWSSEQMGRFALQLVINPLIYTELCHHAGALDEVEETVRNLGLTYQELPKESLFLAAQAYKTYRQRGGTKTAPLADFFIGAHAEAAGFTILTRDTTRYETYFPNVPLICP